MQGTLPMALVPTLPHVPHRRDGVVELKLAWPQFGGHADPPPPLATPARKGYSGNVVARYSHGASSSWSKLPLNGKRFRFENIVIRRLA